MGGAAAFLIRPRKGAAEVGLSPKQGLPDFSTPSCSPLRHWGDRAPKKGWVGRREARRSRVVLASRFARTCRRSGARAQRRAPGGRPRAWPCKASYPCPEGRGKRSQRRASSPAPPPSRSFGPCSRGNGQEGKKKAGRDGIRAGRKLFASSTGEGGRALDSQREGGPADGTSHIERICLGGVARHVPAADLRAFAKKKSLIDLERFSHAVRQNWPWGCGHLRQPRGELEGFFGPILVREYFRVLPVPKGRGRREAAAWR